ncbi:hypothetical protein FAZ15_09875 [Sphingobacterium olei]|uniref:Lipoprotein n=1 Tax=Sphingobacterium olei TaxID=2571155 RepID=A0A4U0P2Q6_9SPHI|nr:hypothetical protein [Sphingobacterium olei]TJZ61489.1 hypothetical protein FAZ15_09875 [Sphingobacterium olei]
MKVIKIITTAAISSLFLFSCGEKKNNSSNKDGLDLEAIINKKSNDSNAKGDNKCLLEYQTKYDQLLSEDDVIAATGFSKSVLKTKSSMVLKDPEYHSFEYKFSNGRMRTMPMVGKLEIPDVVKVKSIKAISLTAFESTYKAISDEEMQVAKEALNDVTEGKSGDAEADAALKKAEEHNVSKEQVKEIGGGMMDVMKEVSKGYRVVDNLGDAARWNIVSNELYILQNGVQLVILCEVNDDNEKNRSVAIALAKIILNKCE